MLGKEEVIQMIMKKNNHKRGEIEGLIAKEVGKYSGLLTENGAALLVAKQLSVRVSGESDFSKIGLLREGMHGVNLKAKVDYVSPLKKIKKGSREFMISTIVLSDESGKISLKLWNEKAERVVEEKVERSWAANISNAYVGSYNKEKELNLNFDSELSFFPEGRDERAVPLGEIKGGMDDFDVYCKIKAVYGEKKFKKDFKEGKLVAFEVEDLEGKASVGAVAWNDAVDEILALKKGMPIKIEAAYAKENNGKTEIHLGWKSRVVAEPKV